MFYNPTGGRQFFGGSVTFDQPIVELLDSLQLLQNSASFVKLGMVYNYSLRFVRLEPRDREKTPIAAGTITIGEWASGDPGGYLRVLTVTAVPEPASFALTLLVLSPLTVAVRRRLLA